MKSYRIGLAKPLLTEYHKALLYQSMYLSLKPSSGFCHWVKHGWDTDTLPDTVQSPALSRADGVMLFKTKSDCDFN